jgi:hypothetical protein
MDAHQAVFLTLAPIHANGHGNHRIHPRGKPGKLAGVRELAFSATQTIHRC